MTDTPLARVRAYHRQTKHAPRAYAPGPGFLDWDSQPDPFRRYHGAALIRLPLPGKRSDSPYDDLFAAAREPQPLDRDSLSLFLELALGLSAWKTTGTESWALRHNPSSGNLHPTEGYLVLWTTLDDELSPGIYHYAPAEHGLERRAAIPDALARQWAEKLPGSPGAIAFSSIPWREEWKYGARALRYCQHDAGHALATARFSAALQGWSLQLDTSLTDAKLTHLLGLHAPRNEAEVEHPDLLAFLITGDPREPLSLPLDTCPWPGGETTWEGQANILSLEHAHWPHITRVIPALEKTTALDPVSLPSGSNRSDLAAATSQSAETVIRRRRSAQRMEKGPGLPKTDFLRMLARTLPSADQAPFDAFPFLPAVHLFVFVHAVEGLAPGLYALVRHPVDQPRLAQSLDTRFDWQLLDDCRLPLYALQVPVDLRKIAAQLSCFQAIAGHSAFSLAMVADMGDTMAREGAWAWRRLHWETGLIGQVLYLEAGASGISGTGIGCFFDDSVHELLGLEPEGDWQVLYHFTVGKALVDERLSTLSGYHHLRNRGEGKEGGKTGG